MKEIKHKVNICLISVMDTYVSVMLSLKILDVSYLDIFKVYVKESMWEHKHRKSTYKIYNQSTLILLCI